MTIIYSKHAKKFIKKQDKTTKERLYDAINQIPKGDIIKMTGYDYYRLRIGDFRIFFNKQNDNIYINVIDNRGKSYNKKNKKRGIK